MLCQADRCMRRVLLLLVPVAALATLTATGPARGAGATGATGAPAWSPPLQLPKWSGSEPSVAIDPKDASAVYVSAPQHIPAVLNQLYCWCHCRESTIFHHRSLLECFESDHASQCSICMGEATLA